MQDRSDPIQALVDHIIQNIEPVPTNLILMHELFDLNSPLSTFKLNPPEHYRIKKISILMATATTILSKRRMVDDLAAMIQIQDDQGKKKLYIFRSTQLKKLLELLAQAEIHPERAFSAKVSKKHVKSYWDNLEKYNEHDLHDTYMAIRNTMAESLITALKSRGVNENITLVDMATGLGDCLDTVSTKLQDNDFQIQQAIGFDSNKANIKSAKKRFSDQPYDFFIADMMDLEELISAKLKSNAKFVVITGSGALTRLVMDSTLDSLKVLQKAHRVGDMVILNGVTDVLTTKHIVKKIGWHSRISAANNYVLYKDTTKLAKIKDDFLDLSLHANPVAVLAMSVENKQRISLVTHADIGLCYFKAGELAHFLNFLPNLKCITISGKEEWHDELVNLAKGKNIQINVNLSKYIHEYKEHSELRKFSINFYDRYKHLMTFKKDIAKLDAIVTAAKIHPEALDQKNLMDLIMRIENFIANNTTDPRAEAYLLWLAQKLENGVSYLKGDINSRYFTNVVYKNLEKSLHCWSELYKRGYAVLSDIQRVRHKLAETATNFDVLKKSGKKENSDTPDVSVRFRKK